MILIRTIFGNTYGEGEGKRGQIKKINQPMKEGREARRQKKKNILLLDFIEKFFRFSKEIHKKVEEIEIIGRIAWI